MPERHWSDDELIGRLYEVGPDDRHLKECPACVERWRELITARARVLEVPAVSEELLAGQRQSILRHLETGLEKTHSFSMAPGLAVAAVLLLGLLLSFPRPNPQPSLASSDSQFFFEVYKVVQSTEPVAVEPVHQLFEVQE